MESGVPGEASHFHHCYDHHLQCHNTVKCNPNTPAASWQGLLLFYLHWVVHIPSPDLWHFSFWPGQNRTSSYFWRNVLTVKQESIMGTKLQHSLFCWIRVLNYWSKIQTSKRRQTMGLILGGTPLHASSRKASNPPKSKIHYSVNTIEREGNCIKAEFCDCQGKWHLYSQRNIQLF